MAEVIEVDDLRDGYRAIASHLLKHGHEVSPRGMRTLELQDFMFVLTNPYDAVPVGIGRRVNTTFGALEVAQFIAGVSDAAILSRAAPHASEFVEHDRFYGAYGPRVYPQFGPVIRAFRRDPDSRQLGVVIWRPDELQIQTKDVPCTLDLRYTVRDGRLDCSVVMRSNDLVWGLTYDAWVFTAAQCALARALAVPVGQYTHHAMSFHTYVDRDAQLLDHLHPCEGGQTVPQPFAPGDALTSGDQVNVARWVHMRNTMEAALGLRDWRPTHDSAGPNARWYRDRIAHLLPREERLCVTCRFVLPASYFGSQAHCRWCDRDIRTRVPIGTYSRMMLAQEGKCAICRRDDQDLWMDHDHQTGVARGLLCDTCNKGLGLLYDSPEACHRAAAYLENDDDPQSWTTDFGFLYRARPRDEQLKKEG